MKQLAQKIWIAAVVGLLLLMACLSLYTAGDTDFSAAENRSLAAVPAFSKASFYSGEYFAAWETWLADHLWQRDRWLMLKTRLDMVLARPAVNQVVITQQVLLPRIKTTYKDWDFREKAALSGDDLQALAAHIQNLGGSFLYVGAPDQYSMFRDFYPTYMYNDAMWLEEAEACFFDALAQRQIAYLDMRPVFLQRQDLADCYFKGDHHYTLLGAYCTYQEICLKLNEKGYAFAGISPEDIHFWQLENPFSGSRSRKLYGLSSVRDQAWVYALDEPIPFRRWDDGQEVTAQVFDWPADAQQTVNYSLYMGGDIGETIIDTARPELPNVLLFGDSFTNALETLLYTGFNQTRTLDLRYYQQQSILQYIEEYRPDIVICLRNDTEYMVREGNGAIGETVPD